MSRDLCFDLLNVISNVFYLQTLEDCRDALKSFDDESSNVKPKSNSKPSGERSEAVNFIKDFECKMADDLHTAEILKGSLQDALKSINNELNGLKVSNGDTRTTATIYDQIVALMVK